MDYARSAVDVTPSARRLTTSLRDMGYDFVTALADIVDNSIASGADKIDVEIVFEGAGSYVLIADDGSGMRNAELEEAMRFGTRREYASNDLGRFGLGLKTASISQCRRLTVVTRRSPVNRRLYLRTLDLDHIGAVDRWEITGTHPDSRAYRSLEWLNNAPGTVVLWEQLDRVLPVERVDGGWARRRIEQLAVRSAGYLGMVFHRFIEGDVAGRERPLVITVNGEKVTPWNPFAPDEPERQELARQEFELSTPHGGRTVRLSRYVLPPRDAFSSPAEFERLSGPQKWNRQQGLYIYRAERLVQGGGWCGIRAADEHTKFARAALDFGTGLDESFRVNVAKMRVSVPAELRTMLERPVHELCHRADAVYRRDATRRSRTSGPRETSHEAVGRSTSHEPDIASALLSAALAVGEHDALCRIMDEMRLSTPGLASALGW